MDEKEVNRITLEELALEIAKPLALAARTREGWEEADAMSLTISQTLHKIGMPDAGLPGVRPHILKMLEDGEIAVRSTRNGLPPVQVSDVTASNFEMWYLTREDADKVRAFLIPETQSAPAAKVATKAGTNVKAWDDARLRALWEESLMPDVKQTILAKKHGVTRQRIGALLKDAREKFSKMKSSPQNKNAWGQLINK